MSYLISPKNDFCYLDRAIFQKNQESFRCGVIWKKGSIHMDNEPRFLELYDPNIGIALSKIGQKYSIEEYLEGERFIYFSNSMGAEERGRLADIYLNDFDSYEIFNELGWHELNNDNFMFGELEVIKTGNDLIITPVAPSPSLFIALKRFIGRFATGGLL